jgi:phage/plasmid-like protein (TIGR03299 family)
VRSDLPPGHNVLEIVGSKYQIIQNQAALHFVQNIIDADEVVLENAGTFDEGRSVFLLAKTDGLTVAGERLQPYIIFSNSHDGSGKVKAALTTIRVVCKNTLSLALREAPRVWAVTHTKSAIDHMRAATESMNFVGNYLTAYPAHVERLMNTSVSETQMTEITERLYPIPVATKSNTTSVRNATFDRDLFVRVYNDTPDLRSWHGTAWGVLGAVTDVISHREPQRTTTTFEQNRFARNAIGGQATALAQEVIMRVAMGASA